MKFIACGELLIRACSITARQEDKKFSGKALSGEWHVRLSIYITNLKFSLFTHILINVQIYE